jgi:thiol-disulfide isomerase/thioredoxin
MKNLNSLVLSFVCLLIYSACDKIEGPKLEAPIINPVDSTEIGIVNTDTNFSTIKKVLVEDYTGHTCGNCPEAAIVLDSLLEMPFKNQIVPMAIHAGSFAEPQPPKYPNDFRTAVGTELDIKFRISAFGNPNGMVDRIGYPNDNNVLNYNTWQTKIDERITLPAPLYLAIKNTYFPNSKKIKTEIKSNIISTLSGDYRMSVFLIEDSIISDQKDYSLPPAINHVTNYVHKHMFRTSFNGTYGDDIASNPSGTASNPVQFKKEYILNYNQAWNKKNLYVVVFVYNKQTYEVIQADYKKIKT